MIFSKLIFNWVIGKNSYKNKYDSTFKNKIFLISSSWLQIFEALFSFKRKKIELEEAFYFIDIREGFTAYAIHRWSMKSFRCFRTYLEELQVR